jgi:hypothetical protein
VPTGPAEPTPRVRGGTTDAPTPHEAMRILELDGRADAAAVKRAYRRLARAHHPDAGGDAATFQRVQAAYEVLAGLVPGAGGLRVGAPASQVRASAVAERWWESSSRWHDTVVDTSGWDLTRRLGEGSVHRLDRDLLASLLRSGNDRVPVRRVVARSRLPGSRLHRFVGMLEPDFLAELDCAPATTTGIPGHDVAVTLTFRTARARRLSGEATLPWGWTRSRTSSSVRIGRTLHPCRGRDQTAVRVAGLVDEVVAALAWPLSDWFVVTP